MKYLRLIFIFAKNCLIREMEFKGNFLLSVGSNLLWFATSVIFFAAIYDHTADIGGWTAQETLLLLSTNELINRLYGGIFGRNISAIPRNVWSGKLDHVLLKPLDSQFLASFRYINFNDLLSMIFPLTTLVYSINNLNVPLHPDNLSLYLLLVIGGVLLKYLLGFLVMSASFWVIRTEAMYALFMEIFSLSGYPHTIFRGAIRVFFTFVIPIVVIANFPALTLLGKFQVEYLVVAIFILLIWGVGVRLLWKNGTRRYASASS